MKIHDGLYWFIACEVEVGFSRFDGMYDLYGRSCIIVQSRFWKLVIIMIYQFSSTID